MPLELRVERWDAYVDFVIGVNRINGTNGTGFTAYEEYDAIVDGIGSSREAVHVASALSEVLVGQATSSRGIARWAPFISALCFAVALVFGTAFVQDYLSRYYDFGACDRGSGSASVDRQFLRAMPWPPCPIVF